MSGSIRWLKKSWVAILGYLLPLIFLPLILVVPTQEAKCAYVVLLMASYWVFEPIPLAVTAMLPLVLFPMFGITSTKQISKSYINASIMMLIGGLTIAIAIENCNLHRRIALKVLLFVGSSPRLLMLGFMFTTMFLSMWISNTATTAMMVPIVLAIMDECHSSEEIERRSSVLKESSNGETDLKSSKVSVSTVSSTLDFQDGSSYDLGNVQETKQNQRMKIMKRTFLLSICYSASCGGVGALTGTGPNLILQGFMEDHYGYRGVTFTSWLFCNFPVALLSVFCVWGYLYLLFVKRIERYSTTNSNAVKKLIQQKYDELGSMNFHEAMVLLLFILLVLLWFFREPLFMEGWADVLRLNRQVADATPAFAVAILLFLIPARKGPLTSDNRLLTWSTIHQKMPWSILLLMGGGFAISDAGNKSGLSKYVGMKLSQVQLPTPLAAQFVLTLLTAFLTEFTSNSATANILIPLFAELATAMGIHPLYLLMPVTVSTSFAFMLPAATPPNAIVFDTGEMTTFDMAKTGLFLNFLCCGINILMINTIGTQVFGLSTFPEWANVTKT